MKKCKFCNRNELGADIFYEDEDIYAIISHKPLSKGHVVIIPLEHYESFEKTPIEVIHKIIEKLPDIISKLKKITEFEGYNIVINNGNVAGQEVSHLHIHIIPRYDRDEIRVKMNKESLYSEEIKKEILKQKICTSRTFRRHLKSLEERGLIERTYGGKNHPSVVKLLRRTGGN